MEPLSPRALRSLGKIRYGSGAVLTLCPLPGESARVAAAGRDGVIKVFQPFSRHGVEFLLQAHTGPIRAQCLIERPADSPLLASAGNDATVRIWDLDARGPHGKPLTGHDGWIWDITSLSWPTALTPLLASAGADRTILVWDPILGRQVGQPLTGHKDQVRAVICVASADGRTVLASGSHDGTVRLWHPATGSPLHTIPLQSPVLALMQQEADRPSIERTNGGATVIAGLRTGILALELDGSLFPPG